MPNDEAPHEPYDGPDLVPGQDGLPVRLVGHWSRQKHHFLLRYINTFTTAMKGKPWFDGLGYIDLFAGPGKCKIRNTSEEIEASPILALTAPRPGKSFDELVFADLSRDCVDAIRERFRVHESPVTPRLHVGDSNQQIGEIIRDLPRDHLYLAFIDPPGLDIHFDTVRTLAKDRRVDLIISFMDRLDLSRNLQRYLDETPSKPDFFFGDKSGWRERFRDLPNWDPEKLTRLSLEIYQDQLRTLGYEYFGEPKRIKGTAGAPDTPFYLLLFASKHDRGADLWNKASNKGPGGQRPLPFT